MALDPLLQPVVAGEHGVQLAGGRQQVLTVGDEQLEEPLVLGHQSEG